MRTSRRLLLLVLFCLLHSALCPCTHAQCFSVDWSTIDGGGGTSAGCIYSVTNIVGQPDAGGAMTDDNYSLTGGFWSLIASVQIAGAPKVAIGQSGCSIIVSWPSSATGWTLVQCTNLATGNWAASGFTVSDSGTTKSIATSSSTGNLFFRLAK